MNASRELLGLRGSLIAALAAVDAVLEEYQATGRIDLSPTPAPTGCTHPNATDASAMGNVRQYCPDCSRFIYADGRTEDANA
jgi:hypothetical protein